jgi:hypothetical protein
MIQPVFLSLFLSLFLLAVLWLCQWCRFHSSLVYAILPLSTVDNSSSLLTD